MTQETMNARTIVESFAALSRKDTTALVAVALVIFLSRWLLFPLGSLLALAAFVAATAYLVSARWIDDSRRRLNIAGLRRSAMYARELGLYQRWYFELR